jgi:hypothetical protein
MHSVFLSYSRQELTFADSVFQELVQRDIPIWMDIYRLKPGEAWQEQIFTALDTADTLLFIVSRASIESENCIAELKHARRTKKRVIYLVFESVDYILQDTNAPVVDFRRPFNDAMRDLNELLTTERVPHTGLIASLKEKKLPPTPARFVMASVAQSLLLFVPVMLLIVEYLAVNTQSMVVMLGSLALGVGLLVFFSFAALRGWTIPGAKQAKWLLILNPLMFFMAGLFLTPSAMRDRTYRYWRTVLSVFFWMLSVFFWLPITVFFMLLTAGGLDIESTMFDSLGHGVMIIAGVMLLVNVALFVYLFYLMGTPGMYRWAGPYGIPFTRYAGPVRFLRWPGLLMIVCGIGAAVLIIRGVTHPDMAAGDLLPVRLVWFGLLLVFVTLVVGVITGVVYYVSRSARRYRRIARIGERGQSTAAGWIMRRRIASMGKHWRNCFLATIKLSIQMMQR